MKAVEIGALRHRLLIEAPAAGADGMLGFEPRGFVWAAIERRSADALVRLRARGDVSAGWRFRQGPRRFEIMSVTPDEIRSGFMTCVCKEVAP